MLIYAAIAAFGFLLILVMLFSGELLGGDHDVGHDGSLALGDGDGGGPSLFSVRIMSSFLTAFGVGGVVGRYYGMSHPAASGIGVAAGVVTATLVYQFAKLLYSQQASSEVHMTGLVGRTAEVTVAIVDGGVGQVTLTARGERSDHIARSRDGLAIPRGAEVIITGLTGDSVVVSRPTGAPGESQ